MPTRWPFHKSLGSCQLLQDNDLWQLTWQITAQRFTKRSSRSRPIQQKNLILYLVCSLKQEHDRISIHATKQSKTPVLSLFGRELAVGLLAYLLSSFPVWIGVVFSMDFLTSTNGSGSQPDLLTACSRYDGLHYKRIVERGYFYDEKRGSAVAFFPGYPLLAKLVVGCTGWSSTLALLVASNVMLVATFVVMSSFLKARWPEAAASDRHLVLALLGVFPAALFSRMTYSESTFLFGQTLFLNGMARRWPLLLLAVLAGAVTGIRPVGVACTAGLVGYVLFDTTRGSISHRIQMALLCLPLACWGLFAYMAYQEAAFDNSFAFAQTQEHWRNHSPRYTDIWDKMWDKGEALLTAEPIWSVYDPDSKQYWGERQNLLFSLQFWNPIVFVGAFILVVFGWYRLWLTGPETILGVGLLAIPYVTRSFEMAMASHARFAAVVVPAYVVAGRLIQQLPPWAIWAVLGVFSAMSMAWSALFAAGQGFF